MTYNIHPTSYSSVLRVFLLAPVVVLLVAAAPAYAAGRQAQERAARKACLGGDYGKGVEILAGLFVDTKNPTYIFNQGRCFEQNHRHEDAISRFEEYLRTAGDKLSDADRAEAEKHIADCKTRLPGPAVTAQATTPQAFVTPLPTVPPPPETPTIPEPSTAIAAPPSPQSESGSPGTGLRITGIVAMSVGVAAVAAGVLFNLKANSMVAQWETTPGSYSSSQASKQKNYQTLMWAGYGAGAACLVTGAILYGVGVSARSKSSTDVALFPVIGPGHAGALFTGVF